MVKYLFALKKTLTDVINNAINALASGYLWMLAFSQNITKLLLSSQFPRPTLRIELYIALG